ncbi:MAG: hypothetical protein Q4C88_05945 [Akkermansia sp.]|nr:hypothetical protein [Akkermansia sp.]
MAPNQPNPENVMLNFRIDRFDRAKLRKLAARLGVDVSVYIRSILEQEIKHVKLTEAERAEVLEEIEEARRKK